MTGLVAELRRFRLPLREVLRTGGGTTSHREGLLLSVGDGEHTGWGEATPMPGWSDSNLDDTVAVLAAVSALLSAVDDPDDPRIGGLLDDLELTPHARAAMSGAIADLRAHRAGESLASALSTRTTRLPSDPTSVAVNALIAASLPGEVADQAIEAVEGGYVSLKAKVGVSTPTDDIDRLRAVRRAVGAGPDIRIDANGSWDVETAVSTLAALSDLGISYCEEPVPGISAIAAVGARSAVPVAVDESARSLDDIAAALATGSIGVVIVKPQALGGPDLAMRAIELVADAGATAIVTSMLDGAIGVTHALHVAAASGVDMAHGLATSSLLAADVGPAPVVVSGRISVGGSPGLGVVPFDSLPT